MAVNRAVSSHAGRLGPAWASAPDPAIRRPAGGPAAPWCRSTLGASPHGGWNEGYEPQVLHPFQDIGAVSGDPGYQIISRRPASGVPQGRTVAAVADRKGLVVCWSLGCDLRPTRKHPPLFYCLRYCVVTAWAASSTLGKRVSRVTLNRRKSSSTVRF